MAFGGAGPLHALDLAAELSIGTVIVPPSPGLLCAVGLLLSPWRHDETMSLGLTVDALAGDGMEQKVAELSQRADEQARADGVDPTTVMLKTALDLRYLGQGYEITVPFDGEDLGAAVNTFHVSHRQSYGYDRPLHPVEVMTLRLIASAPPPVTRLPIPNIEVGDPIIGQAEVIIGGASKKVDVVDRARLRPGSRLKGPILIEQPDTTLLIIDQRFELDNHGNLLIEVKP
jgi:N-methylhydantoinase A